MPWHFGKLGSCEVGWSSDWWSIALGVVKLSGCERGERGGELCEIRRVPHVSAERAGDNETFMVTPMDEEGSLGCDKSG